MGKGRGAGTPTIENRRARHRFALGQTLEVGVALTGSEVKSVRQGRVSLSEGYVRVEGEPPELWLIGVNIAAYPPAGSRQHEPTRARRLLAHRREIRTLARAVSERGTTLVPLKLYFERGRAKLLIAVARGQKRADRREAIAEREAQRDMARAMSRRMKRAR